MTTTIATTTATAISSTDVFADPATFDHWFEVAKLFASSHLIPEHFRGKPQDVMIGLHLAKRIGEDPLHLLQSIYVVAGRPGFSAAYMLARANTSGVLARRIWWTSEGSGEALAVTAHALPADGSPEVTCTVGMDMAIAEGWTKNPKYRSMPEIMLRYRSATLLIRQSFPEVLSGYHTTEELLDVEAAGTVRTVREVVDVAPAPAQAQRSRVTTHAPAARAVQEPAPEPADPWVGPSQRAPAVDVAPRAPDAQEAAPAPAPTPAPAPERDDLKAAIGRTLVALRTQGMDTAAMLGVFVEHDVQPHSDGTVSSTLQSTKAGAAKLTLILRQFEAELAAIASPVESIPFGDEAP